MKVIKIDLPSELEKVEILPLADLHLGDGCCDVDLIKENIEYIRNHDGVYTILNGDIINNSTKSSVGDVYGEELTPMQQLERAYELLNVIKDKILCITNGNHENRTYKMDGIDLMEILARELGVADRYTKGSAVLFIKVGNNERFKNFTRGHKFLYTIYCNHGFGGGKKPGGKVNSLESMADVVDCDIYLMSHTHLPAMFKENYFRVDATKQTVIPVEKLFVNTNAYLNYGGYGETYGFRPASKDAPRIFLSGKGKKKYWGKL